jgi:CRISPR-associated protein Csb2
VSLNVQVSFPLGRYHATPWDRHVNEGAVEWPPSPWRMVRALIAVWHDRCPELDQADVVQVLNVVGASPTYHLPRSVAAGTRHYYPGSAQQLPTKPDTSKVLDTFRAVDPAAVVQITWPGELSEQARKAATVLFERMSYLGRADSICEARVVTPALSNHPTADPPHEVTPDPDGELALLSPGLPIDLGQVTVGTDAMRSAGYAQPKGSHLVRFRVSPPLECSAIRATRVPPSRRPNPTVAVLAVSGRPAPMHELSLVVAERVRSALQSVYGQRSDRATSPTFAGHRAGVVDSPARLDDHQHLHLLPVAGADRRIDRIIAWAPEGFGPTEVAALAEVSAVYPPGQSPGRRQPPSGRSQRQAVRGLATFHVVLAALGEPDEILAASSGLDLVGPSRVWRSLSPMMPTGHPNRQDRADADRMGGVSLRFVRRRMAPELRYRSKAEPTSVEFLDQPPRPAQRYRRHRIGATIKDARPATWLRLTFDAEIAGPLSLGRFSHLGLGLFEPEPSKIR